jgi:hypothetical protein
MRRRPPWGGAAPVVARIQPGEVPRLSSFDLREPSAFRSPGGYA